MTTQPPGAGTPTAAPTTAALAVGSHDITVRYTPTADFGASGTTTSLSVDEAATTLTLTASPARSRDHHRVALTATVTAAAPGSGTPAGTVVFTLGRRTLGPVALDARGQATLTTNRLPLGHHTITASYQGNASYQASSVTTEVRVLLPRPFGGPRGGCP